MSLPDGVTTCLLTYGPITDTFGNLADSITVEVVADRTIVHAASGRTMFKHPVSVTAEGGGVAQLPVPHTDQAGFRDQQQNALTGWYYTVTLTARFPGGGFETDRKTFQPLVGQVTRDADLLSSPGMVTPGVTVDGTAVTSVNGQTGDVDLTATIVPLAEAAVTGALGSDEARSAAALRGRSPQKVGVVLEHGTPGAFDAALVEGGMPLPWDGPEGAWAMVYVGYTQASGSGGGDTQAVEGSIGIAFSDDLLNWAKAGQIFKKNPTPGQPDSGGITGPVMYVEGDTMYLFYIALTGTGYEAGEVTLMLASLPVADLADGLANPGTAWTRRGTVLGTSNAGSGWRSGRVYHVCMTKDSSTYTFFVNALDSNRGKEVIGYFTAPAITGPYTADDANSPVLDVTADTGWEGNLVGDPVVYQHPDGSWVMHYYGADFTAGGNGDGVAVCQAEDFPVGPWVRDGVPYLRPSEPYDEQLAHKPQVIEAYGLLFHFYTAVNDAGRRVMALAIDAGNWDPSGYGPDWRRHMIVALPTADYPAVHIARRGNSPTSSGLVVGDDIKVPTVANRARMLLASIDSDAELFLGQAAQKNVYLAWHYNANPNSATAELGVYGNTNRLNITPDTSVGRAGGDLAFYGAAPVARPALTYSRAGETAAQAQIRTALASLGLVADNTTS